MTRALFASLLVSSLIGCNGSDLTVEEDRHRAHDMARPNDLASGGGTGGNGSGDMATSSNPDLATGGGGTGGGGGGTPGSGLFPSTAPWYTDITNAPKDAQSDAAIAAMNSKGGWGTGKLQIDFSITVQHANASTPMMRSPRPATGIRPTATSRRCRCRRAAPSKARAATPAPATATATCSSSTTRSTSSTRCGAPTSSARRFNGGCLAVWDLTQASIGARSRRGLHQRRRRGFPIAPLLFNADEVAAGAHQSRHPLHPAQRAHRARASTCIRPRTHGPDLGRRRTRRPTARASACAPTSRRQPAATGAQGRRARAAEVRHVPRRRRQHRAHRAER